MKIKLIYLAAGNSRRFFIHGKQKNKLLQQICGKPLYRYGLEQLKEVSSHITDSHIYVVTQYPEIYDDCMKQENMTVVFSSESKKGLAYSIRNVLNVAETGDSESCYLFLAADQPLIQAKTIETFITEFLHSGKKAGNVIYGSTPGNPAIFHQDYVEELKSLSGDQGGRKVLKRHPEDVFTFQLEDEKEQKDVDDLRDFQTVCGQKLKNSALKIYVAGSGGKTSLIHYMAEKYSQKDKKILILTTTHMMQEEGMILLKDDPVDFQNQIKQAFHQKKIVAAGKSADVKGKITWIGKELYGEIEKYADVILIEADGSKRLPAKFPNETEPVIYADADQIYVVFGLTALDQKMKDACHRYSLAEVIADQDAVIDEDISAKLLKQGYLKKLKTNYPYADLYLVLNQADDENLKNRAEKIAKLTNEDAIILSLKKEF